MEEFMNKFKDFIYDKSDILIALGILLIAALIIGWRLAAIVEYPKEIIDDNNNATEYNEETPSDKPEETPADKPENKPEEQPSDKPEETPATGSVYGSNGLLTRDVTVDWSTASGASASAIIQCAVDQGLFEDYDDYANVCLNNGITDPEQIPVYGTSTFTAGMSKLQVAQQIKK